MKKAKLKNLAPEDLQAIGDVVYGIVDKQVATLATKKDIADLKVYMNEGLESVMDGVDEVANKLAAKEPFEDLKKWAHKTGYKADLKLK